MKDEKEECKIEIGLDQGGGRRRSMVGNKYDKNTLYEILKELLKYYIF